MNKRIKEVIVAINNHKVVFADTNITNFVKGMKALEPKINSKESLKKHLDKNKGVFFYVNDLGAVYEIYRFKNENYAGINSASP